MTAHTPILASAVTGGPEVSAVRLAQVRDRARDMIRDETRSVVQLWGWAGRDTHRAILLAHVTGSLPGYCDQLARPPDTAPREIVAVLRGVLDAVTPELRPPRTRILTAVDHGEGR